MTDQPSLAPTPEIPVRPAPTVSKPKSSVKNPYSWGTGRRKAAIALGAVTPKALRFPQAEKLLEGKAIDEALAREAGRVVSETLNPAARGVSKEYAKEVAGVLVRRALLEAFERVS